MSADKEVDEFYVFCENLTDNGSGYDYEYWFLIPSVIITVILSFMEKRRYLKPNLLGGRPGLTRPLSFLVEPSNRLGIMIAFGSVTSTVITTTFNTVQNDLAIWAKVFLVLLRCIETSVICYPLFACMTSRHKLVGAITGLLYSTGWFSWNLFLTIQTGRCYTYGKIGQSKSNLIWVVSAVIMQLPQILCTFLTIIKFTLKLYTCLNKRVYTVGQKEQARFCRSCHLKYVKMLLKKNSFESGTGQMSIKDKLIHKTFRSVPGFRFPVTVISAAFMSSVMLFEMSLLVCVAVVIAITDLQSYAIMSLEVNEFQNAIKAANGIATLMAIFTGIRNIYLLLINYRRDMLSLYRGDQSFIPGTILNNAPQVYLANSMRFLGTTIAGMLWGTVVAFLVFFVPLSALFVTLKLIWKLHKFKEFFLELQWLVYPVCMIVIYQLQVLISRRFFMQAKVKKGDNYKPLAIDNRNVYDNFSFFMIFLNLTIGLISFLKRILLGAYMGLFLLPRMDRSLLLRGYENMDICHGNYVSMLIVDVAHNHPVLRVFCQLITESIEDRKGKQSSAEISAASFSSDLYSIPVDNANSIAKRRWWLTYTLLKNPGIVSSRVHKIHNQLKENTATHESVHINMESVTQHEDTWGRAGRCKNYKCKIPHNTITNLLLLFVLLIVLLCYTGIKAIIA